ncbi:MAG: group II truncated hemoglobin [Calditrichaeota bacterium]|jgi:hemoglobin|nr:group II truncated hemoglobin [Deltaproteobacteria bacterium]MBT7616420.1 group II truncated hemoglobin [Calditrichota bacterium]MBT4637283.1 group II truncated hemoglobin [Deltaproteobacteria bacterium]MBT6614146.1 group II truncated hemoglobin [Deltaproteobacteria bacterium]MBT7156023.1 group II truncated hemoglobin [Deltaproteobacteria bacterium]
MSSKINLYGTADNSYRAAGEISGITKLVNTFYDFMGDIPEAKKIRDMHPYDLSESRKKLAYFLSGWLGGPKLYSEHFGKINLPIAHQHFSIGLEEREAWILCMQKAVELQPYEDSFKVYLIEQLRVPAERIRMACSTQQSH